MKYVALDFETGNASPLSACALGVAVFEDRRAGIAYQAARLRWEVPLGQCQGQSYQGTHGGRRAGV